MTTRLIAAIALSLSTLVAMAADTVLRENTAVNLVFDQALTTKTAKPGDKVKFKVSEAVTIDGHTAIARGTRVTGIVSEVRRRGTFGKNAQIQITIDPLRLHGASIGLRPARKGKEFKGSKTDRAAGTAGAGAIVLGPVGLAAGVFVKGKEVEIKKGDPMHTEVARTVTLHM